MASSGADDEDEGISLDIDDMHLLLHVEQEQIQKRTFTKWINAQLAKRSPPSCVSDLFADLRNGTVLLDLLEVITGQPMTRQKNHGVFQQRVDIETALEFLKERSVKLVNINIPDITDGTPTVILGLIWTIILHCHIDEVATSLLNSLPLSLNSAKSRVSTQSSLQKSFGPSAQKVLLTWAQDQCHRAGCSVSVKDFRSSWRSGEAFLAILCSLRPDLVDLTQVRTRTNLENLELAFELAERELHIPRLLEPQDVDVVDPDEKSIMTFVAQFVQFSIKLAPPVLNMQLPILASTGFIDDLLLKIPQKLLIEGSNKGPTEAQKAKSRLEKTRVRLQARIQQATKLFSNKDITEAEVKRKEKALKALCPAFLEDFLSAVDDYGALCSKPQLQELMLMSESVRKQWEDVRFEMSTFTDSLRAKIREQKQQQQQVTELSGTNADQAERQQKQKEDSARRRQEQVWTSMTANQQMKSQPTSHKVMQRVKCITEATDHMDSPDDDTECGSINKTVSMPPNVLSVALIEQAVPQNRKVHEQGRNMDVTEESWQAQENKTDNLVKDKADDSPQSQQHDDQMIKDGKILESEDVVETQEEKRRKRSRDVKHGRLNQRRKTLLGKLMELRTSAEELDLQEATLPALHQRSRALMRLESSLSGLHSELEHIRKTSPSEQRCDVGVNQELEELWEETTKAVSERLEQCELLAELMKRFQKIRGEVGETLQRAESTVKEQASYMGRDNLHRLHTKVDETKSELNDLGDRVGELRSISRKLHSHLQQVPHCTSNIPFESEAHILMDQWLDISERVESHLENLHFALSLWDGALKLEQEAEQWTINKEAAFAHSPTFRTEEDVEALKEEMRAQEESAQCLGRISAEIQALLQTSEPPPELQVGEAQMRKKLGELREIISEAEDVFRQTEAAKAKVTERINEYSCSLQAIHQALLSLSGPHPAAVLSKLTDLYQQLQVQDEQVEFLQEDLQLLASVGHPGSMETLCNNGHKLQDRLTEVHQLFSEVEKKTQRDIQLYNSLQTEVEHLKQWLNNEVTLYPSVVQGQVLHQRRTESPSQLMLLLRNSTFQHSALVEESGKLLEQLNLKTSTTGGPGEPSESMSTRSCVKAVEIPDAPVSEICEVQRGQNAKIAAEENRSDSGTSFKDEIQKMQGEDDPRSSQTSHRDLQISNGPNLNNNIRDNCISQDSHWLELETFLRQLKAQLDEVCVTDEESLGRLLQDGCQKLTSLQRNMITDTPASAPKLEVLQQLAAIEKDLSQHAGLKHPDSNISQQMNNFLNHKRALDVSVRERMSQEQQMEKQTVDTVSNNERSILKQSVYAEDSVKDPGWTQDKRLKLQQPDDMEQNGASNQTYTTPGSSESVSVNKEDKTAFDSRLLHSPENETKIEIQESFSLEETLISTVPGKDPNTEQQETYTIVQDSKREKNKEWTAKRVEIDALGHTSVEDSTAQNFSQDEADVGEIERPKHGATLCTMQSANKSDKKVPLAAERTDDGHIKHFSDTGRCEEKQYLDSIGSLLKKLCKLEFPGSCEDTDVTPEQTSDMDTEQADEPGEATGGSYNKHKFTMRDLLAADQSWVENSCIINSAPRFDLSWFLKSSSGDTEIQLMRILQRVLVCRYQAAQLGPKSMTSQLQEAENLRCCVQEQVVTIQNRESDVPKSIEGLCSAALLEASTTVHTKETQLQQVKKYHRQLKMTKAFLEVVATQKEKMSLDILGSCELQAEQLGALLKTMDHKRCLIDDCVNLSGQLSLHLGPTDRFGVLVANFGSIQEEWRLLEQSIQMAQQQASNSASQIIVLRRDIQQLKDQLEGLLISLQSFVTFPDFKNTLHLLTYTADVKMCSQQYANLRSQFDSLAHFYIGQNDNRGLKNDVDELGSLLDESKMKLRVLSSKCGSMSSTNVNRQLQDFFLWTKQAENRIIGGEKLSLFPEEAQIQIAEMEGFHADLLHRHDQIEEIQSEIKTIGKDDDDDQVLHAVLELYQTNSNRFCQCLKTMKENLKEREILFAQLASIDEWLADIHGKRDPFALVEDVQRDDYPSLEKQCNVHKENALEIESKLKMAEEVAEGCKKILIELSPGESHYLLNRLAGVRSEIGGLLANEKALGLESEELIQQWSKRNKDLSNIEADLERICLVLKKQRFPLTQESVTEIVFLKYKLLQHRCQVQGILGYQEVRRSSILDAIGELLEKSNALCLCAAEQDKYMQLQRQMEQSRDTIKECISGAKNKETSLGERFRLCQNLLVELPLVKTHCQEVADQLEAIAPELYPSELNAERQKIRQTVETLVSLERTVTEDIKNLESKLILGLCFETELPVTVELMRKAKKELEEAQEVDPDEKEVDVRLQKCWVLWRNMESAMRVLEGLARKQKKNLRHQEELYESRNAAMKECLVQMESLSEARESLKDYQWAAQGATGFLRNAEATFLSASGGFVDCTEEQRQTQQALDSLEAGLQAHLDHLTKVVPQQHCLSRTKMEKVHIEMLSRLLVGRAVLEAQAQLRLEALQRCSERLLKYKSNHESVLRVLCGLEDSLSKCAAEPINSYDQCTAQQNRAKLLKEDVQELAGQMEELKAGCPMPGCGAGRGDEVGALWRRWAALRRIVGLLSAHTEQRAEEWKDITITMEQCNTSLTSLQTSPPPCSPGGFSEGGSVPLLARAKQHRAGLETQQRTLASLERRLEHALSPAQSHAPSSPLPLGHTLLDIKDSIRSLKERNRRAVEAARVKEKEEERVVEELTELESHVLCLSSTLENCSTQPLQQECKKEVSSLQTRLQHIVDSLHSCYNEIPFHICTHLQHVQLSLQRAEERVTERSAHVALLSGRVEELRSGLERVKELLKQRSPSVAEAQQALKHVWDELDMWHGRLMLLESEVQDLAEDLPDQAHVLMDQLTEPLQCYQNTAQRVEQHTAFLSKIPACMHKFEDVLYRATCWLDEAESWLGATCSFTTAKCLQNHANSLQLLLGDSERIRLVLQEFRPVLCDVSAVCDVSAQACKLEETDRHVLTMQKTILQPLGSLLQAATVVEDLETELKTIERNVSKIEAILSAEDNSISPTEHLHNRQVILSSAQSAKEVLQDMQKVKEELELPLDTKEKLMVFCKATSLWQHIEELEHLSHKQTTLLENIREKEDCSLLKNPADRKQDPDEAIGATSRWRMDEDRQLATQRVIDGLPCEQDSLDTTESWLLSVRPWLETSVSENVDSDLELGDLQNIEMTKSEPLISTDISVVEKRTSAVMDTNQRQETHVSSLSQLKAGLEDTRLVPVRPITPFSGAATFEEEENERPSLFVSPAEVLDTSNEINTLNDLEAERYKETHHSPKMLSQNLQEETAIEQPFWSQLSEQICQTLCSLDNLQKDFQVSKGDTLKWSTNGHVLRQTQQAVLALRSKMSPSVSGEQGDLLEAFKQVLLCLDDLTGFLLTSVKSGSSNSELGQLERECVRGELATLSELLTRIELGENMEVSKCVKSLQQCISRVSEQLQSQMGLTHQQVISNHMIFMDYFDLKRNNLFQGSEEAPMLQCVLVRHLRRSPGAGAGLRQASQSLLQGMSGLVELGEECTTEGQTRTLRSQSELQHALQRTQRLQEVVMSQLAFAHYLSQQESLKCHEDEWAQLQIRARALRQRALDQQASSHRSLQEWTQWEDNYARLGRLLDESETFLSAEEQEGSEGEELQMQKRVREGQRLLSRLDQSRATLGLLLEQGENLQLPSLRQKGGALELRWRRVRRQTEQDIKRCGEARENRASCHTDMASLTQWLIGAQEQVQTCSDLATSDLKLECVPDSLIKLLDLCTEVGVMSVQKESMCRKTCPGLKEQITSLESQWSQLTSALLMTQEQLQQHFLKRWPPDDLLSALEDWLKKKQAHLNKKKEETIKAKNSAYLTKGLPSLKGLRTGLEHGQLLLDFLCQSGPPLVGEEAMVLRCERTRLAEKLGDLRLSWVDLRGELESQISEAENMHQSWSQRQKKLQHLQNSIDQTRKKVDDWKRPYSEFLARKVLLEWEGHLESLKDVAADVEEVKNADSNAENEKQEDMSDIVFAERVEGLGQACADIIQQVEAIKPSLLQTLEKWSRFKKYLNEISSQSVWLHCSLRQLQAAPIFSLQQAERHLHDLQDLPVTANISEDIWDSLNKSFKDLVNDVDPEAAHVLNEQMEREEKRWRAVRQDLSDEIRKAQESVSAWQDFTDQTQRCSLQLHKLWSHWEELEQIPLHCQYTEHRLQAVEDMQEKVESVKCNLKHVLEASKRLTGRLNPVASNIVQSQTGQLSYDVSILNQTLQMHKRSFQVEKEQLKDFKVNLEKLENQSKELETQMNGVGDADCAKQVFWELACLFSSVFDVSEMSAHVNLSNQEEQSLHTLKRTYVERLTRGLDLYKQLHLQHNLSLDFDAKCKALKDIQDTLEQQAISKSPQTYTDLRQMAAIHLKFLGDIAMGHKLLHVLQCDALIIMENTTLEQRSETLACVSRLKEKWTDLMNVFDQSQSLVKQQLKRFVTYRSGVKHLYNVLNEVDALLPPTGAAICVSPFKIQDYEDTEKALQVHTAIYTRTVDVGRALCESMTDVECQMQLKSEIHALEEAWECATSQLEKHKALIHDTVQKWGQSQLKIAELRSGLDQCGLKLKKAVPTSKDVEEIIQETEFSLQRMKTGGLNELDTMKMDMSPYVPAGDTALLEKQLEQLHGQWEDLCMKVSLRKQEIADRLNAWTIFNDKNKEFCDWLMQMENKVCHSADLSFEEMVEKLKKDCMEEINLFSENKRHLKQLGEQLLWASDEAKQSQVHGSLQEANQRWTCLFHHIEARVKKLKETLATVQQLDKNMSNLRSWLCRIEAELSRPITYSVLHHQEIQKRLAEHQELQRDIEQHTEGVTSVLNLCDVLLQDDDASNGTGADGDSLQETSRSLDQRWRTICALALDRRLRIEETWRLWCKFLDDYSRFEDWLKMAERTAANPNTGDVPYTVAKEELKKFEGFQRQVNERLTQLEIVNNQYRRLARENRTDRASQLRAMVHGGNRRWDALHRRVGTILRRLKYFTSQREDFESTRESMLVWLTELDLQLTNVEHFSESDVHHKIQQLNSFQKEITVNTERIDGLIVFGEGLIQRSSPQDAALIEEELEELHSYCQEVFGRLVRFHHRLSQPPIPVEPESPINSFSLEPSLELIGRPWLGRSLSSALATPTHLLATPLSRSGCDTPVSVDSLPLEWDHTGDVGGSSSHEDEDEDDLDDEGAYFSAVSSRSVCDSPKWQTREELSELESDVYAEALPTLASTPLKQGNYMHLMSQCSGSIEDFKRVSLILDDEEPDEFGLTGINLSGGQSGVIERWELAQAQSQTDLREDPQEQPPWSLDQISSWLHSVIPQLQIVLLSDPPSSVEDMSAQATQLKEMHKTFAQHKSTMLSLNLNLQGDPELQSKLASVNQSWSQACTDLQRWDTTLRKTLLRCQEFHESLHSLLLWLAHAESRRYTVDIHHPETTVRALRQHRLTLTAVREELIRRQSHQSSLQTLWSQLQPEHSDDSDEAQEKLHVTGSKMRILLRELTDDLQAIQQRLVNEPISDEQDQRVSTVPSEGAVKSMKRSSNSREGRDSAQPRSFFLRLLRAAFPLHLLLLLLLLLSCLVPMSPPEQSCTVANNFQRSFYPMLRYTNGPPPT